MPKFSTFCIFPNSIFIIDRRTAQMNPHLQDIKNPLQNLSKMNFNLWKLVEIESVITSSSTNEETTQTSNAGFLLKYVDTEKPGNSAQTFSYVVILLDRNDEDESADEPVFYDFEKDALGVGQNVGNRAKVTLTKTIKTLNDSTEGVKVTITATLLLQ